MKPKKRETQKQTSRVWLRNHDHRDVIYDLVYHNAMYLYKMKRDKQGQPTQQVETNAYVWFKYPHKYLLIVKIATAVDLGFIDIERQFVYSNPSHTLETAINGDKLIVVDDAVYLCNVYQDNVDANYNKIRIGRGTIDGTTWRLPYQSSYIDFSLPGTFKIGLNCYCSFIRNPSSSTNYWILRMVQVSRDDDLHITLSVPVDISLLAHAESTVETTYEDVTSTTRTMVYTEKAVDYIMMGAISTGCVVRRQYIKKETRTGQVYNSQRGRWEWDGNDPVITYYWQWEYWKYHINGGRECLSLEERETPTQAQVGSIDIYYFRPFESVRWNCNMFNGSSAPYRDLTQYGSSRVTQGSATLIAYVARSTPYAQGGNVYYLVNFYAYMTHNEGADWDAKRLGDDNYVRFSIGTACSYENFKIKAFFREGYFYVMTASQYINNWKVRMFSSLTGVVWEEVYLPRWLDVPFSTDAGIFTYRNDFADTVRIAISPGETQDQDYNLYELEWDALEYLFTDGELDKTNEQFFITFMKKPYTTNMVKHPGIFLFFDTKYLAENAQSFALKLTYETDLTINDPEHVNALTGIAEQVMDYDYCAPPGGFAGQDPDPDTAYIYYVWDSTNQEWDIVDRHLSTYAHYAIIVVEDLPDSGLANTLYAIRTDINKNNIYEYFVWNGEDFVSVNNLALYSHHTLVMVDSLPYTGQLNIIYAVPLDFSSYTTNMYIWNPEAPRYEHGEIVYGAYEDLNYTTYDMTGKKYNTINVKRLPDTGRTGIIYISEEKYTPNNVTHEDNTYNFYQWDFGNGKWQLVSPVINKSKFNIIEVYEMPPGPPAGMLKDIYKIPKELDGKDTHDMYKSESELLDFLQNHTFKHSTVLYSKDQLPLVGSPDVYYIIKEGQTQYTGKYAVYLYNVILKQYDLKSEYEYWISDDPEEPKEVRKVNVIEDWVKGGILENIVEGE